MCDNQTCLLMLPYLYGPIQIGSIFPPFLETFFICFRYTVSPTFISNVLTPFAFLFAYCFFCFSWALSIFSRTYSTTRNTDMRYNASFFYKRFLLLVLCDSCQAFQKSLFDITSPSLQYSKMALVNINEGRRNGRIKRKYCMKEGHKAFSAE